MKHLGDITKIKGSDVEPVNVIVGGSPCQDLSIAGQRAGLKGERSGLFMDQLRVIKEMRFVDEIIKGRTGKDIRPRFMVWENVPGAFSSNKGADFGAVLQETAKIIVEKAPIVPIPKKGWPTAGCITGMGDRGGGTAFSIAWRVFDAQFWGVPQRRRRIALIADFGGLSAPEILFERKSLSGNHATGRASRKAITSYIEDGASGNDQLLAAGFCTEHSAKARSTGFEIDRSPTLRAGTVPATTYCIQGNCIDRADSAGCNGRGWTEGRCYTLNTVDRPAVMQEVSVLNDQGDSSISGKDEASVSPTLRAEMHGNLPAVAVAIENHPSDGRMKFSDNNIVQTLRNRMGSGGGNTPMVLECYEVGNGQANQNISDVCGTLNCMHDQKAVMYFQNTGPGWWNESDVGATLRAACGGDSMKANLIAAVDCRNGTENSEINGTLQAKPNGGQSVNLQNVCRQGYIVRRLTPLECERLQGFPDGWTDIGEWIDSKGKKHKNSSDSARYKALGNSIALPPWLWVFQRLSLACGPDRTMASLFDGIGGFPLMWEYLHGEGSCIWASEIEEFPMAITRIRFKEMENNHEIITE